jgi:ABC-type nitrate/sulfonate/bicarbonate transport system ATPase subunit
VSRPEVIFFDEPFASGLVDIVRYVDDADAPILHMADRSLVFTPPPGKVAASIEVGLAHPRTQAATRSSAGFLAVRNAIHDAIARQQGRRGEVR